ncbi:fructosamine kinase family protein [Conexibacter sp. W3-3-2]|nr:fructosamine kinase family protein [Conexibacter sp. W3-3-2]
MGRALGGTVGAVRPVTGGDLNLAFRMVVDGHPVFVKTAPDTSAEASSAFPGEAAGLLWLAEPGALPVPAVLAVTERFLALQWVEPGPSRGAATEEELGRGLAAVHAAGAPAYGGAHVLRLGPLALADGPAESWAACFAQQRLEPLIGRALDLGRVDPAGAAALVRVCERMDTLAGPPEPPARVHGDLWSGNVHVDRDGRPWLVDPAAHGGHREVDLAMLRLFGGMSERCFSAYEEVAPLADGHRERVTLWQLFPLLVHAVLFGGGYGARATEIARRLA